MIVLNFSHPLTSEHLQQVETLAGEQVDRVLSVERFYLDADQPFAQQVIALVDSLDITPE